MLIATILPTKYLDLEDESRYHLALAHQIDKDLTYAYFFLRQSKRGAFVMMDNGAAEYGVPMDIDMLISAADLIDCQEMVLPDFIHDYRATLNKSWYAMQHIRKKNKSIGLMGVPHGETVNEWISCAKEMLEWDINTIGISKFIVPTPFQSRLEAIMSVPGLIESNKDIHLLGYTNIIDILDIKKALLDRIRGIDSSIPTLFAQIGKLIDGGRPDIKLDLDAVVDRGLLERNVSVWKASCETSTWS